MLATLLLVVITVVKGFKIEENPFFIGIESLLNLVIVGDFVCRLRLMGCKRYFSGASNGASRLWNWLDASVVLGSLLCFIVILSSHSAVEREEGVEYLEELSEIILLVVWALFQTLRVIFIAKRQRLA
jgi:hypothetical protein